ncbi:MAG: hypothetical protein QM296_13155 [Bacillota bacterium]|nr:hypothetical protein [Bacillota bacterium]
MLLRHPDPVPEPRRLAGFRLLRALNLSCIIVSFWPLLLLIVALLGFGSQALREPWRTPLSTGIDLAVLALPAVLAYLIEPLLVARDPELPSRVYDWIDPNERLPERSSELLTARELARSAERARRKEEAIAARQAAGLRGWLRARVVPALRQLAWFAGAAAIAAVRGWQLSPLYSLLLALCAVVMMKLCIDAPLRSYAEIYRLGQYAVFLVTCLVHLFLVDLFGLDPWIGLHIVLFFYITMVHLVTRNQLTIDTVMRRGNHSLDDLPRGLRVRNALLVLLLTAAIPVIYLLRHFFSGIFIWSWNTLVHLIRILAEWLGNLFRGEVTQIGDGGQMMPDMDGRGSQNEASWFWDLLQYALLAGIITLLWYRRRELGGLLRSSLQRLRRWLSSLMQHEVGPDGEDVERHALYSDHHSNIDPARQLRHRSRRRQRRDWRQSVRRYLQRRRPGEETQAERTREGFRLLLNWLELEEADMERSYTAREIERYNREYLATMAGFDETGRQAVLALYEWARYDDTQSEPQPTEELRAAQHLLEERLRALAD